MDTNETNRQKKVRCGDFLGVLEEAVCPICTDQKEKELIFRRTDNVGIWTCPQCNIVYASPRFTEASLLEIYENEAFITDKSFYENWSYEDWKRENKDNTYKAQQLKIDLISRFLSRNDKILDFGCGKDHFAGPQTGVVGLHYACGTEKVTSFRNMSFLLKNKNQGLYISDKALVCSCDF